MLPPITIYNKGDVLFFKSTSDAKRYLEPIDVLNGEYVAYDSEGKLLELTVQNELVAITLPKQVKYCNRELSEILLDHLVTLGLQRSYLSSKTLQELIAIRLTYKTD